jgi:hypothetical protein
MTTAAGLALLVACAALLVAPERAPRWLAGAAGCVAALLLGHRHGAAPGIALAAATLTAATSLLVLSRPRPPRAVARADAGAREREPASPRPARAAARDAWRTLDGVARVTAALAGTLPPALLAGAALAAHLPLSAGVRFAIGAFAIIPLWVCAMTFVLLVRRGWVAWALCLVATAALALIVPGAAFWPSLP